LGHAAEWFDVRARSILVNFLEIWLKKEGSSAPTAVRNEHIANLDSLRTDLKGYLSEVDFFRAMSGTIASPPPAVRGKIQAGGQIEESGVLFFA